MLMNTITGTAVPRMRAATLLASGGALRPDLSGTRGLGQAPAPTHVHTSITDPGHPTAIPL
ncbi:MAG TPA: hypothetical protein VHO26_08840 [Propionibacteriaceae bacterium]|nr:hypothetical protein [Propionibacteriaceae bacterium]